MLRLFPTSPSSRIRRSRRARRLGCETLEVRQLLSSFTVNEFNVDSATTSGSLRWALTQATTTPGNNTVTFDPTVFNVPRTITLTAGELSLSDTNTSGGVTVTGPGANLLTVSGNDASRVFDINGAPAALSGLTITGGSATSGGGLYNSSSDLSLTNVTISGNSAMGGGGLFNTGTASLTNVTISGNSAVAAGGLFSDGPSTLTNVTVSGNSASQDGGGLYNYLSNMSLTNVTVSGNSASQYGGGLMNYHGTTSLTNTIVAGNTAGGDVAGSVVSSTKSLIGGNALLAPLGFYGGSTETMPLLPGSPAIGGGTATGAPTTDQRGVARTGRVDIGAFQSQGFNVAITGGDNQGTNTDTSFPSPLSVTVTSAYGEPVAGGVVTFTGPAAGPSATFTGNPAVIGANGSASVSATANGTWGVFGRPAPYAVSASTGAGSASFSLVNYNPPPPVGRPIGDGILIDGSAAVVNAGDSLRQTVSLRNASPSAPVNTRIKVVYNTAPPKVPNTGSSRDRFVFTYSKDVANEKATDFLN
jgi:hypothetical protein